MSDRSADASKPAHYATVLPIIGAIAVCHMLNDLMQSLIPAIYPILKDELALTFGQIGLITFVFQGVASLLQPVVGLYTDRRPLPFSLVAGMGFTLLGLLLLAKAAAFWVVLVAVALVGLGSSVFHPESSRIARLAAGKRPGFAQSVFQVGGNAGSAIGPLLAAFIVVPFGQGSIGWFALVALAGMTVLWVVGRWYAAEGMRRMHAGRAVRAGHDLAQARVVLAICVLIALTFSKFVYMAAYSSYYTFWLIDRFQVSVPQAQLFLFLFLLAVAVGTIIGGPIGDRIGRKRVIWVSILGVSPLALLVPHLPLWPSVAVSALAGMVLASAFPAIIVYAQDLLPKKVGLVAGLFFGLAFGMGALGAAALGQIADATSIGHVFFLCSFLPLIGVLAVFLPDVKRL
ncbi:MFS transporter [Neotabrizicola shimadae]|uniref:MFS transporter n=1 Tax=Neotabrizicola shimadae TaxID=2807096 RepID=A0A8G0ZY95_9RHOB|nr:MFS transporter [Neotabrizicola shimadae]QYZ71272.1 MFS transporter [Neotabrizicola shimadae]